MSNRTNHEGRLTFDKMVTKFKGNAPKARGGVSLLSTLLPFFINLVQSELVPPWPDNVVIFGILVCTFVAAVVFFFIRYCSLRSKRRWGVCLLVLTFVGLFSWLVMVSMFVVKHPDGSRLVKGFSLREKVAEKVKAGSVGHGPIKLLDAYGWDSAEEIWRDVRVSRWLVCSTFLLTFAAATASLSTFALQDIKRSRRIVD